MPARRAAKVRIDYDLAWKIEDFIAVREVQIYPNRVYRRVGIEGEHSILRPKPIPQSRGWWTGRYGKLLVCTECLVNA